MLAFLDAVGLESAHLVTHDWGGIIGFKVVADHPERVRSIALLDTLCTIWPPRGRHGYWFKAEGLAEDFFARYHEAWIEATFAGRDGADLPGAPASPWPFRPGARPRPTWIDDDALEHYRRAFSDPASWSAAIQYYRYALPFHRIDEEDRPHLLSERQVAEMWLHPGGLAAHPLSRRVPRLRPRGPGHPIRAARTVDVRPLLGPTIGLGAPSSAPRLRAGRERRPRAQPVRRAVRPLLRRSAVPGRSTPGTSWPRRRRPS